MGGLVRSRGRVKVWVLARGAFRTSEPPPAARRAGVPTFGGRAVARASQRRWQTSAREVGARVTMGKGTAAPAVAVAPAVPRRGVANGHPRGQGRAGAHVLGCLATGGKARPVMFWPAFWDRFHLPTMP